MINAPENPKGPALGGPAPYFETTIGNEIVTSDDFKGGWTIVFSHPGDLMPVFKTRTINYILCKRRTKVVALGDGRPAGAATGRNIIKKYILKHSLSVIDDPDKKIAESYGLTDGDGASDEEAKGIFVIDPLGILRIKLYFPLAAERNFYEILKLVDALQDADKQRNKKQKGAVGRVESPGPAGPSH